MTKGGVVGRRFVAGAGAVALTAGLLIAMGAKPASAASNVTSVTGSALGYHSFNIHLIGGAQSDVGPTPTMTLASDASNSPQSSTATTGVVAYGPATLFTSDAISIQSSGSTGTTGSVSTSSSVNHVNKATTQPGTGSEALTADNISGSCSSSASATSGSTTVTNGTLLTDNGDATHPPVTTAVPANPAPNTTISGIVRINATSTDSFHYVFNEQTTSTSGVLTVNPVDEYFDGPNLTGNLIIGQVVCGVTTLPGTDVSVQNPGITHTPNPVPANGSVTFTITVSNLGPNSAPSVVDTTTVTGGHFVGATTSAGTCAVPKKSKDIVCTLGTVPSGQSPTIQITIGAPRKSGSTIAVSSTVSSPADTNPANNTSTDSVLVQ